MNGRYIADYMVGSELARRRIVRDSKYRPIARIIQHERAKSAVARFLLEGHSDCGLLTREAQRLRDALVDSDFERELFDNNADYVDAFVVAFDNLAMPKADLIALGREVKVSLSGVDVNADARFGLQRTTKTNKVRTGYATLRYAKGKPLATETGLWQSSLLYGTYIVHSLAPSFFAFLSAFAICLRTLVAASPLPLGR